ncbi:Rox3-domain-containing protein [Westerdykella ornata]|uniref:Mediator of RNA polymerase II transcription subunit 19 n=1 Tax=Westerdykella ornata TaxID=318751 RepID=A0A6A6JJF9_WESOR|nr:Rox3-domain-containing protein [Westerdykella ornata]KAF2276273.1 Rox3-domain-containing protein [Westerdykella ornata]
MTPPSSVHMSQQPSQSAASASNPPPFATPSSLSGAAASSNNEGDGDFVMADNAADDTGAPSVDRRTDHERDSWSSLPGQGAAAGGIPGSGLFKLAQTSHPMSRPNPAEDLFSLFGLSDTAKSVARTDPNTGEKINKLRKSYEGHIKALQIAGKAKAVKHEHLLTQYMAWPEEEYRNQRIMGNEFEKALDMGTQKLTGGFESLMNNAFAGMGPGALPPQEAQKWRTYLGTDEVLKTKPTAEGAQNRNMPTPSAAPTPVAAPPARAARPERPGAKRSYMDASFQGYSESFADDSSDKDDGQSMAKKRRLGFERTSHQVEVGGARR